MEFLRRQVLEPGRLERKRGWLNMDMYNGQTSFGRWTVMPQPERPVLLGRGQGWEGMTKATTALEEAVNAVAKIYKGPGEGDAELPRGSEPHWHGPRYPQTHERGVGNGTARGGKEEKTRAEKTDTRKECRSHLARGSPPHTDASSPSGRHQGRFGS